MICLESRAAGWDQLDRPLDTEELKLVLRRLGRLGPRQIVEAYRRAHQACRMEDEMPPPAAALQELMIVSRLMRAWKGRRRPLE
jgi:hypothetical protein